MKNKAKRLVAGSVLGGSSFILSTLISLFMTPFMISCFGDQIYGLWMLVASFSGFYGVLDLGLSTAVQRYMARAIGTNDIEEAKGIFNTSLVVFFVIGFFAMIFAGVLSWLAPVFVKNAGDVSTFRLIIIICSVNIIIGFPMRSFWGILSSNLRYDISVYLYIANVILKTVLIILFLKLGFSVVAVATIHLITDLAWNIATIISALKIAPYIRFSISYVKPERLRMFFGYSVYVFISRIADIIKSNLNNYVISAFVGLSAVTIFSIGIRLIDYSMTFLLKLVGLMTPVFSQYEGRGDFNSIKEKFFFTFKLGVYIAVFLGVLLTLLAKPFISRWVGVGYSESVTVIFIFIIPTIFRMMMATSDQLLYGISKHKFLTWLNSAEALANLALSLIFVRFFGIQGVALGAAIPMLVTKVFIQPVYTAKVLGVSVGSFYLKIFFEVAKAILVLFMLYMLTKNLIAESFSRIIAFGIIQACCYGLIMFKIGFSKIEQQQVVAGFTPVWIKKYFI